MTRNGSDRPRWGLGGLLAALVVLAGVAALAGWRCRPPAPVPADADTRRFSAERAWAHLEALVGEGIPHPVGSKANETVQRRVTEALQRAGYAPKVQAATVPTWRGGEVTVHNVMARREGTGYGPAVMLVAHYDSVPEGPGASDDGVGVAVVLEVASMLAGESPSPNDVIFLITDGEEAGLCGARAFIEEHPWADDVGAVINLEARGTSGASLMFQCGEESAWLIDQLAAASRRPITGSLFTAVYERMPNDTDFTVFKRSGMTGYNFAFIGDVQNYHTPNDDLAHVSMGSFQHHGDQALGLLRQLAEQDLAAIPTGDAVFFDLFATVIVRWPRSWTVPLALAGLALVVAVAVLRGRRGHLAKGEFPVAAIRWIGGAILAIGIAWVLERMLQRLGAPDETWPDQPAPLMAAFWSASFVAILLSWWPVRRSVSAWSGWIACWIWLAIGGLIIALALPEASYVLVAPTLAAGVIGLLATMHVRTESPVAGRAVAIASAGALACLWFPLEPLLYQALGFTSGVLVAARSTIVILALGPLLAGAGRRGRWLLLVVAALALVIATPLAVG